MVCETQEPIQSRFTMHPTAVREVSESRCESAYTFNGSACDCVVFLEASTPVADHPSKVKDRFDPIRIWPLALCILRYALASTIAVLLVATISPRLVRVQEPWQFFLVGGVAGCLTASALLGSDWLPQTRTNLLWLLLIGSFILTALAAVALSATISGVHVSPIGAIVVAVAAAGLSLFVYQIFDAPEPSPGD